MSETLTRPARPDEGVDPNPDVEKADPRDASKNMVAANAAALGGPGMSQIGALDPITRHRVMSRADDEAGILHRPYKRLVEEKPTPAESGVAAPKNSETNLTIAERQRQLGENPSGDPNAHNPYGSASGKNQIIDSTWMKLMQTYRPEMVQGMTREQILALKTNGPLNDEMAREYDKENARFLSQNGIAPTPNFINAAYRAGPQGALAIIRAAQTDPSVLVKTVAPDLAKPGNNGAGNMTVGQFLMNPYGRGPGGEEQSTPRDRFIGARGNDILSQMQTEFQSAQEKVAKLDKNYKPIEVPERPKPPDTDPLATFGTLAGVFATLAAGFSRTPANAAMNALAGAIQGAKQHDWEIYKAEYDQFKTMSDMAFKAHEQHSADIKDAMEMMNKNMAAGTHMMNATIALSQDDEMKKLHDEQKYEKMWELQDKRNKAYQDWVIKQPEFLASADLTARLENLRYVQEHGTPEEIQKATQLVTESEARLADVKRSHLGGFKPGTGSAQEELRLMADFDRDNPGATIDERAAYWNRIKGREDPTEKTKRLNAGQELKERHEQNWRQINEDRTATTREVADKRIAAAAEWHKQQADLTTRKLDENATISERKSTEEERHHKIDEQIKSDWHLTQAEKDVLNRNEAIRWHDLQNERGWGGIESRERIAEEQITSREKIATDRWKAKQIADDGSQKAERRARYDELVATMPEGTPASKIWDAVDSQMMEAKAPHITPSGLRAAAERFIAGDATALQGFGRNPTLFSKIESEIAKVADERGLTGADLVNIKQNYAVSTKALKDFATGKQGQTAQALNVATQHLVLLSDAAKALSQNDSRTINRLENAFKHEFGWDEPITFNAIKTIVGSEVEKAVAGSSGALEDRRELRDGLSSQSTPGQLASVIEGYKGLMAGQLQGLEKTYERTTKRTDFRDEFLLPEAKREMERIAPRGGQSAAPTETPPVPEARKAPDGKWYVPDPNRPGKYLEAR